MKKKILMLIITCIILLPSTKVLAENGPRTFTNDNGVTLTQSELNFVNNFYGVEFFQNMTADDYNWIADLNLNTTTDLEIKYADVETINIFPGMARPLDEYGESEYSTVSKKLSVAKSCGNVCTIISQLKWLVNPTRRSYDLIGARFYNTSLIANTNLTTMITSSAGTAYSSNNKVYNNGLGTSVDLPDTATNIVVQQKFYLNHSGKVYVSYQHTTSNISLQTSYNYFIGAGGYGNVFIFYDTAVGKYDGMGGTYLDL